MQETIVKLLEEAVQILITQNHLPEDCTPTIHLERPRDKQHGDFASNVALSLAKQARTNPRALAEKIINALPAHASIEKVELAGPGFINIYLSAAAQYAVIKSVLSEKEAYGRSQHGEGQRILLEFVSANPTGPLHVGHGRSAAFGSAVANLLEAVGFSVDREYYVNDAGRQMDILTTSVWLRYLELQGESFTFPLNAYQGDYIIAIAQQATGKNLHHPSDTVFENIPAFNEDNKETAMDALIARCKTLLGESDYAALLQLTLSNILGDIRNDLEEFGVSFQSWFSERSLVQNGAIEKTIDQLKAAGHTYEEEGALWFRATEFGDDKDRVLLRANGAPTYFAADIANHREKIARGYAIAIDVFGADHHGYVARLKAALSAMEIDPDRLKILLVQFAVLWRGKERIPMSTRSGKFVTLRELREEVGRDAARYFYLHRKNDQHMDFDLELAKSRSQDNPVYYIQYAHARICSVFRQLDDKSWTWDQAQGLAHLDTLTAPQETRLIDRLNQYPELLLAAAEQYAPHLLTHYLRDLANDFHTYYNAQQFLVEDSNVRDARLALVAATQQVLINGLTLLGMSRPDTM